MVLKGAVLNAAAILIGGAAVCIARRQPPPEVVRGVQVALGLFTLSMGVAMSAHPSHPLAVLLALTIGTGTGYALNLGKRLTVRNRVNESGSDGEARKSGIVTASLLFCVGPMAILGAIQEGLQGDISLLSVKSVLDFFTAAILTITLGPRVLLAALPVLAYEGLLTFSARIIQPVVDGFVMQDIVACGGLMTVAIAIGPLLSLAELTVANFLPSLILIVPLSLACARARL